LIFISLAQNPSALFEPAFEVLSPLLKPQGFNRAKMAKAVDYVVNANWKLVWENNPRVLPLQCEPPAIHQGRPSTTTTPTTRRDAIRASDKHRRQPQRSRSGPPLNSRPTHTGRPVWTVFPDAENNIWFSANRTPLVEGWVSESMDGRQLLR
jgi:hypothetical protein